MSVSDKIKNKNVAFIIAILLGTIAGLISVELCIRLKLVIYGFNLYIIVSPIIAGFVETFFSKNFTNETSGAISSIILFVITNLLGWIFTADPIIWNVYTVGGFFLMIQAAFPLTINYILLALLFLAIYLFGRLGSVLETLFVKRSKITPVADIQDYVSSNVLILTNEPEIPIKKYHGLIFAESVIEFEDKKPEEVIDFIGSDVSKKNMLKQHDYAIARDYMLNDLKKNAEELGANAIVDIEIEYTNFNQQFPPDVLIAIYGTAVTLDEAYLI